MYNVICSVCRKNFERLYQERKRDICYNCALEEPRGELAPEEGDFNSARIISGEMTEQEERWLREELEAVESGRSIHESYEEDGDSYVDYLIDKYES